MVGVQAQQAPEPLQVPPVHAVPCASGTVPQALLVHVATAQVPDGAGHCAALTQLTQVPVARSQIGAAPAHAACAVYWPLPLQSWGTLPLQVRVPGWHTLHWPLPSHCPAPPPHVAPRALGDEPQAVALHVAV